MTQQEITAKIKELSNRRYSFLSSLEAPVRAAAAAMTDAGMANSARPLNEIIFELDELNSQLKSLWSDNRSEDIVGTIISLMREKE